MKKLPLSIQTFEDIIQNNMVYVDKTFFIYSLINSGKYYFLSRPRRFGKSLLLSTLKSFFEGEKELFKGLFIYDKEKDWITYPIINIDYSRIEYKRGIDIFISTFLDHLQFIANQFEITLSKKNPSIALEELIYSLQKKYQQKVVILVDEYDKPMVDMLHNRAAFEENRELLRTIYGALKGLDNNLRFIMLTGVSQFAKVGVFSGMNNLDDISLNDRYSSIVGFTQKELETNFREHLEQFAQKFNITLEDFFLTIKKWYNGFSFNGIEKLYNPFSILKLFTEFEFRNYWFSTGTPSFLMNLIITQEQLPEIFEGIKVIDLTGSSIQSKKLPLIPLLFQTGYLTIEKKEFDNFRPVYYLNYPNEEVRHSFLTHITAAFLNKEESEIQPEGLAIRDALLTEDIPKFVQFCQSFLSDIPARLHIEREAYYHSLVYLMLRLIGTKALLEKETDKGRIDAVLELTDKVYIIEFKFATNTRIKKVETLSRKALKQIKDKKYYEPYLSSNKRILLLGLGFLEKKLHGRVEELHQ